MPLPMRAAAREVYKVKAMEEVAVVLLLSGTLSAGEDMLGDTPCQPIATQQ